MRFSANIEKLEPSATIAVSTLAKRLAAEGRDILDLSAGEPDFDTPAFIADAAVDGIRSGMTRYTPPAGLPDLRRAIAARLSRRAGRELDPNGVVVTAGAKQALFNAIFAIFGPGDEVLIAAPYWTTYPDLVRIARAEPLPVFGGESNDFKITPADLDRAAGDHARGVVINTPCNPTGAVYGQAELSGIAAWARERGAWLISDEIYGNICYEGASAPGILQLPESELGPHVLVDGASKSYAMTGWRIGFSYTDPSVADKLTALQSQITSNAATPSQVAALRAFTDAEASDASLAEMGEAFRRRRDLVTARMRELLPDVPFIHPRGAFYLYFRVDGLFDASVTSGTAWCSRLLEEEGVALVPGAAFGDDRWVRMSFATSDDVLEEALARIAALIGAGSTA
jgi:aspartate aminotransferase